MSSKIVETQCIYTYSRNGKKYSTPNLDAAFIRKTEGDIEVEELNLQTKRKINRTVNLES